MADFYQMFTDIHLDLNNVLDSVLFPGFVKAHSLGSEDLVHFEQVANAIMRHKEKQNDDKFKFRVNGIPLRAQRMDADRWAIRIIPKTPPAIDTLGLPASVVHALMAPYPKGGIILVSGMPGEGKTTTVASAIRSRLLNAGGYCLTIEDPPEYDLTGFHGNGYCEQIDADSETEKTMADSLRCFPAKTKSMFFFGEVRSAAEAYYLLRIALCGHLVMTTVHGNSALSGVNRIIEMASEVDKAARINMSQSFILSVYQEIADDRLNVSFILSDYKTRSAIATGNNDSLKSEERNA